MKNTVAVCHSQIGQMQCVDYCEDDTLFCYTYHIGYVGIIIAKSFTEQCGPGQRQSTIW